MIVHIDSVSCWVLRHTSTEDAFLLHVVLPVELELLLNACATSITKMCVHIIAM